MDRETGISSMMPSLTRSLFNPSASAPLLHPYTYPSRVARRRKERQLEEEFQTLLDAQELGLVAGFSTESSVGPSLNRDSTPIESGWPNATSTRKGKLTLADARTGILAAMRELALVKGEEVAELQNRSESSKTILHQVDEWNEKREGLNKEIRDIETSKEATQLRQLKQEEKALQGEIHELEDRLLQLRAKQRHMTLEISRMTNSVDAKLSSYQASLSLLESNIKRFLAKPQQTDVYSDEPEEIPSFMSLPANRRTLTMVHEHYHGQQGLLNKRIERAEFERDALEDGAQVWEDVLTEVTAYERNLRRALRRSMSNSQHDTASRSSSLKHNSDQTGSLENSDGFNKLVSDTDRIILQLESKLKLAEARNWKLLVCCIGAELEALIEAREILRGLPRGGTASVTSDIKQGFGFPGSSNPTNGSEHGPKGFESPDEGLNEPSIEPANDLDGVGKTEDEDDDPDPDLLVSHEHTTTS